MSRNIVISIGEFYHLYNRGTDKRAIFLDEKDYNRFIALLYICNSPEGVRLHNQTRKNEQSLTSLMEILENPRQETLVEIGAYCLMPNHFHLLIREKTEKGISAFMQKLSTAYTKYFNTKYERSGSLFESTFKAKHANEDKYLKYLYSYIHLNPIKLIEPKWKKSGIKDTEKAKEFMDQYKYSSYLDYTGVNRLEKAIIEAENFPEYFKDSIDFIKMTEEWLSVKDENELSKA